MKEKKLKELKEKGITLVALVVTIIILLILAGVTLNLAIRRRWNLCKSKEYSRQISNSTSKRSRPIDKI